MMKVYCAIVTSPNGYIARLNGQEDWISEANWDDFLAEAKTLGNIVMGRETYELVTKLYEHQAFESVEVEHRIIVTHQQGYVAPEGFTVVHSPQEAMDFLMERGLENAYFIGGGKLNAEFLKAGLTDEIKFIVEPYMIGDGRRAFAAGEYACALELIKSETLSGGRVSLSYRVNK